MESGGTVNHIDSHNCVIACLTHNFVFNTFFFFVFYVPVWLPDQLMERRFIMTNCGFLLDMMEMLGKCIIPIFTQL